LFPLSSYLYPRIAAVGVSSHDTDPSQDPAHYPAAWSAASGAQTVWTILGARVDLYLMPAVAPADGLRAFWDLTGAPKVLPRHAFGFVACRWGWSDRAYIEQILQAFRAGQFPIDSFISDFEWYTPNPDYSLPDTGSPTFVDFAYNAITFPDPAAQLAQYRSTYDVRFGGIRKPRLGNSDLIAAAKAKGWILPNAARNLNYSNPDVRAWYAEQITHFFADGVSYWWNDEGETQYFTFHGWNQAQNDALVAHDPKKRFLTINRSYTPGMQRYGLVIWTGAWAAFGMIVLLLAFGAHSVLPLCTFSSQATFPCRGTRSRRPSATCSTGA
jgi:alpha-glucosidase (family GH31 glycosyl hydrolase)